MPACAVCGAPLAAGARFCRACGAAVGPGAAALAATADPARRRWPLLLGLGLGAAAVLVVAGYFGRSLLTSPAAQAPAALPSAPLAPALADALSRIVLLRTVAGNEAFHSAQLDTGADKALVLAESRKFCVESGHANCVLLFYQQGRSSRLARLAKVAESDFSPTFNELQLNGSIVGWYWRRDGQENGAFNCSVVSVNEASESPWTCLQLASPSDDAATAAADASAAATDVGVATDAAAAASDAARKM